MKDIYIVNYCHAGCVPLKSITQLSEAESFTIAIGLSQKNEGVAFNRFGEDYKGYYPHRIRTEKWLYDCFVSLGGTPETEHPYYFVLQGSDMLYNWFGKGTTTKILLSNIEPCDISFTFGDSMSKMDKPERKDPFLKNRLYEFIDSYNGNIDYFLDSIKGQYTYIEAQLWTDKYFDRIIRD